MPRTKHTDGRDTGKNYTHWNSVGVDWLYDKHNRILQEAEEKRRKDQEARAKWHTFDQAEVDRLKAVIQECKERVELNLRYGERFAEKPRSELAQAEQDLLNYNEKHAKRPDSLRQSTAAASTSVGAVSDVASEDRAKEQRQDELMRRLAESNGCSMKAVGTAPAPTSNEALSDEAFGKAKLSCPPL